MKYRVGNTVIVPGLYRNISGKTIPPNALFFLHLFAESAHAKESKPNSRRTLFTYSIMTGGDFTYLFGNYSELFGNEKAKFLCGMFDEIPEALQKEVYAALKENKSFADPQMQAPLSSWMCFHGNPLEVQRLIAHILNYESPT